MRIIKGQNNNEFHLEGLSFQDIVLIKKSCESYAAQGSDKAGTLAEKISEALENTVI